MAESAGNINEIELIGKWRAGDERSFDGLFAIHFARLHQFALRHTRNENLAEELAMDALLKVWQQKDTLYSDTVSLAPLLFRILQFSIVNNYRKGALVLTPLEAMHQESATVEKADSKLIADQLRLLYEQAIDRLSPKQKMVFKLRKEQEMSYRMIAEELDISTKTVDRHLSDAHISIRGYVAKFLSLVTGLLFFYL